MGAASQATERKRLYSVWGAMVQRCENPNNKSYKNYGGRGIKVCARWRASFGAFIADMGPRPVGSILDRENNNGNYCKRNCRWVDSFTSSSNRRNVIVVGDGSLKGACRKAGLPYRAVHKRLKRGWSVNRALSTPLGAKQYEFRGPKLTREDAAAIKAMKPLGERQALARELAPQYGVSVWQITAIWRGDTWRNA